MTPGSRGGRTNSGCSQADSSSDRLPRTTTEIDVARAEQLIRDADVAASRIPDLRDVHAASSHGPARPARCSDRLVVRRGRCSASSVQPRPPRRARRRRVEPRAGTEAGRAPATTPAAPPSPATRSNGPTGWPAPSRSARSISGFSRDVLPERPVRLVDDRKHDPVDDLAVIDRPARVSLGTSNAGAGPTGRRPSVVSVEPGARLPARARPAATSRSWIGDGRNRSTSGSPAVARPRRRCPRAAARFTSMPTRSMSSNGPIGKPAARTAASTSTTAATPASSIASASSVNGRLTRLTMNPACRRSGPAPCPSAATNSSAARSTARGRWRARRRPRRAASAAPG